MSKCMSGCLLVCCLLLTGCHGTESKNEARALAEQRLNLHKARIKYLLASEQFENGHIDQARKSVREAIALCDGAVDPAYTALLARVYIEDGQLAKAKNVLGAADQSGVPNPEFLYLNGIVAERYGRLQEARDHYRQAHELQTNVTEYLMAYAEVLISLDEVEAALRLIDTWAEDVDDHGRLQGLRGAALQMMQRYDEAARAYKQALVEFPDDDALLESHAMVLFWAGRFDDAVPAFRALLSRRKADTPPHALRCLAECYLEIGEPLRATAHLRDLTRRHPNDAQAWLLLARSYLAADRLPEARRAAEEGVRRAPGLGDAYVMLGFVLYRQENWVEARRILESALRAEPLDVMALCLLGQVAEATGSPLRAGKFYRRALDIDPHDALARRLFDELQKSAS